MGGIILLLITGMFLLMPVSSPAEEVYIWTDKAGGAHIEDQAPEVSPGDRIQVEKHIFEKGSGAASVENPDAGALKPGLSPEEIEAAAKRERELKEKELLHQQKIENARQEYEEASASRKRYLHKYKKAKNAKARHYWRRKLEGLDKKRRQLEKLESAE